MCEARETHRGVMSLSRRLPVQLFPFNFPLISFNLIEGVHLLICRANGLAKTVRNKKDVYGGERNLCVKQITR